MSASIDNAEQLAAKIQSLPACAGIVVLVDRQKNISSEIEISIAGTKGAVIDILWLGGVPFDQNAEANLTSRYRVNVRTVPILQNELQAKADVLCEALVKGLWRWVDPDADSGTYHEWMVLDVDMVPDEQFLIYQLILEVKTEIL